jgi:superoxide dismutase, Cu-Zn family
MKHAAISVLALTCFLIPIQAFAAEATALISGTEEGSSVTGMALFQDSREGLKIDVQISGVTPGPHGIHIHENGSCEDGGNAAGSHYNPENTPHGFLPNDGLENAHAGDFGNIEIDDNGHGEISVTLPGLTVNGGAHPIADRAIILHEKPDDFGQPTGNAGGRIACGIIKVSE